MTISLNIERRNSKKTLEVVISEAPAPSSAIPKFDSDFNFNYSAMSSSSSHPTDGDGVVYIRQTKGAPFKFLVPLVYAPVLPLIRLTLRHRPVLRDRLFTAVLVGAFAHGSYLVADLYDSESK